MKRLIVLEKKLRWVSTVIAMMLLIAACSKSKQPVVEPEKPNEKENVDVYFSYADINTTTIQYDAKIMKNGVELYSFEDPKRSTLVFGMDVSDGKVYAAGAKVTTNGSSYTAMLWENGLEKAYGSQDLVIYDIVKFGGDLFFAMADVKGLSSLVWKNDKVQYQLLGHYPSRLALSGQDVYTGGITGDQAVVLKNGSLIYTLTKGVGAVNGMWVDGNTVYAAGFELENGSRVAKVWKNGSVLYNLGEGECTGICIAGNTVYTSGFLFDGTNNVAKVWKSDKVLYTLSNGNASALAMGIAVAGKDVYAGGVDNGTCKIWKNGEMIYAVGKSAFMNPHSFSLKLVPKQ